MTLQQKERKYIFSNLIFIKQVAKHKLTFIVHTVHENCLNFAIYFFFLEWPVLRWPTTANTTQCSAKHNTVFVVKHYAKICKTQHNIHETQHNINETQHNIHETQHNIHETQHNIHSRNTTQ